MGDIFIPDDLQRLLHNKFVVVIGGSIQRSVYRDLVCLLQRNVYLTQSALRGKGEMSFMGDELIEGGCKGEIHNGKHYREVRQYQTDTHLIRYYYITRCYSEYVESVLDDLMEEPIPDVIIMNSCLWDLTRYGHGGKQYPANLQRLFHRINHMLPSTTLVIWLTAMPVGARVKGGVFLPHLQFFEATIRYDVAEANYAAYQVAFDYDMDVLDLHYHFRTLTHLRVKDGVHWNYIAHRKISNMILSHICEAWNVLLPRRWLHEHQQADGPRPHPFGPPRPPFHQAQPTSVRAVHGGMQPPQISRPCPRPHHPARPRMTSQHMEQHNRPMICPQPALSGCHSVFPRPTRPQVRLPQRCHQRSNSCQPSMLFGGVHAGKDTHFTGNIPQPGIQNHGQNICLPQQGILRTYDDVNQKCEMALQEIQHCHSNIRLLRSMSHQAIQRHTNNITLTSDMPLQTMQRHGNNIQLTGNVRMQTIQRQGNNIGVNPAGDMWPDTHQGSCENRGGIPSRWPLGKPFALSAQSGGTRQRPDRSIMDNMQMPNHVQRSMLADSLVHVATALRTCTATPVRNTFKFEPYRLQGFNGPDMRPPRNAYFHPYGR